MHINYRPLRWLVVVVLLGASALAQDYPGVWTPAPGSGGVFKWTYHFRKDGLGVVDQGSGEYGKMPFRWKVTATGIHLYYVGLDGKEPTDYMSHRDFVYDAQKQAFHDPFASGTGWFIKSSDEEPPDYEKIIHQREKDRLKKQKLAEEEEEQEERTAAEQPKTTTQKFSSIKQLRKAITRKLEASDSSLSFISIGKPAQEFTVRKLASSCFIELYLVTKSVDKLAPNARQTQVELSSDPALPVRYSIPADRADALRSWLTANKVPYSEQALQTTAGDRIEAFERKITAQCGADAKRATAVVEYLLAETFKDARKPFTLEAMLRE